MNINFVSPTNQFLGSPVNTLPITSTFVQFPVGKGYTINQATKDTLNVLPWQPDPTDVILLMGLGIAQWYDRTLNGFDSPDFRGSYDFLFGPPLWNGTDPLHTYTPMP